MGSPSAMEPWSRQWKHTAVLMIDLLQQLRKTPQGMGAEYQIHVAVGSAHLVGHLFLLGHTAAQADYLPGIGLFGMGQGAEISIDPLLGVLPARRRC